MNTCNYCIEGFEVVLNGLVCLFGRYRSTFFYVFYVGEYGFSTTGRRFLRLRNFIFYCLLIGGLLCFYYCFLIIRITIVLFRSEWVLVI